MDKIKYAVIIATYNGEKYIEQQITSILNQTYNVSEIVISDDGSSDKTLDIVENLAKSNPNIHYIKHNSTKSVTDNFVNAFEHIITPVDYVFFADQDDFWLQDKVETFNDILKNNRYDVLFSDAYITDSELIKKEKTLLQVLCNYEYKGCFNNNEVYEFNWSEDFSYKVLKWNILTGMNCCVKYDYFNGILPIPYNILHDKWCFFITYFIGKMALIKKATALYRQHSNNVVGVNKKKTINYIKQRIVEDRENTRCFLNNYEDLFKFVEKKGNYDHLRIIESFISFYYWRVTMLETGKIISLLFSYGKYIKYVHRPFKQYCKDILYIMVRR